MNETNITKFLRKKEKELNTIQEVVETARLVVLATENGNPHMLVSSLKQLKSAVEELNKLKETV